MYLIYNISFDLFMQVFFLLQIKSAYSIQKQNENIKKKIESVAQREEEASE